MKRECCEQQHSDVQNVRQKEISVKLCLECFHVILSKICDFSCKICSVKTVLTVVSEKFWPYFIHPPPTGWIEFGGVGIREDLLSGC